MTPPGSENPQRIIFYKHATPPGSAVLSFGSGVLQTTLTEGCSLVILNFYSLTI